MSDQKQLSGRAWAELILLALLWGGSFLSIRVALDEIGFLTSVAHRVFWAALVLWAHISVRGWLRMVTQLFHWIITSPVPRTIISMELIIVRDTLLMYQSWCLKHRTSYTI